MSTLGRILCFSVAALASAASAQSPLTFDDALALAQPRSRQLAGQQAAIESARDMAVASAQRPDPTLRVGIDNLPVTTSDRFSLVRDSQTMRSIGIAQEFTRDAKLKARSARYEREADAAAAGYTLALADLQRDTAIAWFERRYREHVRAALRALRDQAALQVEAAGLAYRTARGSQADVFAARSALAQIDDRIDEADQQAAAAVTMLARWIGNDAQRTLGAAPDTDRVQIEESTLDDAVAHHPQVGVLSRRADVADAEAQIARTERSADWTVEVSYGQRGPGYSEMLSVNLSVPLQWDRPHRQDRDLAAKLAASEQWRAQRDEAAREHSAEIRTMLLEWRSARTRLARYDAELVPLAIERTRAATLAYRNAAAPLSAVVEARRAEIDARLDRLRLEFDTDRLWAKLHYLIPEDRAHASNPTAHAGDAR